MTQTPGDVVDWTALILEQLEWHWDYQLRARLAGLTDEEYLWEPVPGCWSVRPKGTGATPMATGSGPWEIDYEYPSPEPAPVTTIAWRLGHVIVGVFGARVAAHFGGGPTDYRTWAYAGSADEALDQLDAVYEAWVEGVRGLHAEDLVRACGPAEGPFADHPMAGLVLHVHREAIHHGAEISLLRDLYACRSS